VLNSIGALNALNFFMADVRDGLGPFLGVFLQGKGWSPAEIGVVMTIGGLAGMLATAPLGALVDATRAKRAMLIAAAVFIIGASIVNYMSAHFTITTLAQVTSGIAAAAVAPAIAGITLGLVGQAGFPHQLGRNEAFNHGGNATAACLSGALGYLFGIGAVFVLMAGMAVAAIAAIAMIRSGDIDHARARGLASAGSAGETVPTSFIGLMGSVPLLILGATLMLFHMANAAMLPLLGQAMVARGTAGDASAYTAATVIVAQLTMVPMAILAARLAISRGYWIVFVLALIALPIRGLLAGSVAHPWILLPVQVLDGIGAGLLGVAVPGLVARILSGTGHVNAGLGAVMTMQGVGAAVSATIGGYVAESFGYGAAFLALGGIAVLALAVWLIGNSLVAIGREPSFTPASG
jgi:MFS family permease